MTTYKILLSAANKGKSLKVWGLIQTALCLSRISWEQFYHLTSIMSKNGQFRIK